MSCARVCATSFYAMLKVSEVGETTHAHISKLWGGSSTPIDMDVHSKLGTLQLDLEEFGGEPGFFFLLKYLLPTLHSELSYHKKSRGKLT